VTDDGGMPDEPPLEPRFVVWDCDHCHNGIEFDAVQLAGRTTCQVPCPHCGRETSLREPAPPTHLIVDSGRAVQAEAKAAQAPAAVEAATAVEGTPVQPPKAGVAQPPGPTPTTVTLPPDPPPPLTRAPMDVRWLTDLGVVYFRQHQFYEAYHCFSRAAEQGFATAQFCLAVCYFNGQGTIQDEEAAHPWLQKAAAQGDANAEFTLGLAYRLGRGVKADPQLAAQWLRRAAGHGHGEAIICLGETARQTESPRQKALAPPPPARGVAGPGGEETPGKPRQDLQRLILGLFRKKS
jgi:hypothetical protein